ncbi:uncharacterized protein DS421_11g327780 [Arachis hypogaea]|nr:uncharacterized protein DS421_11g327780 [Arachis hypogaea]
MVEDLQQQLNRNDGNRAVATHPRLWLQSQQLQIDGSNGLNGSGDGSLVTVVALATSHCSGGDRSTAQGEGSSTANSDTSTTAAPRSFVGGDGDEPGFDGSDRG